MQDSTGRTPEPLAEPWVPFWTWVHLPRGLGGRSCPVIPSKPLPPAEVSDSQDGLSIMEWHQSLYLTIKGTLPTELRCTHQRISENAHRIPDAGLSSEGLDHSTQPRPPLIAYHSLQKSLSLPTPEQVNTYNSSWEKSLKHMFRQW